MATEQFILIPLSRGEKEYYVAEENYVLRGGSEDETGCKSTFSIKKSRDVKNVRSPTHTNTCATTILFVEVIYLIGARGDRRLQIATSHN